MSRDEPWAPAGGVYADQSRVHDPALFVGADDLGGAAVQDVVPTWIARAVDRGQFEKVHQPVLSAVTDCVPVPGGVDE